MGTIIKCILSAFAGAATVGLVLTTIINYADIVTGIYSLFRKAFSVRDTLEKIYYKGKREKYYKSLCDKRYIEWQLRVLETIYGPIIEKDNVVDFTRLKIGNADRKYESVTFKFRSVDYPFDNVCPKSELNVKVDTNCSSNLNGFITGSQRYARSIIH